MWLCVFCAWLCVAVSGEATAQPLGRSGFMGSQWQEVDTQVVRLVLCHCLKTTNLCLRFSLFDRPLSPLFIAALHHPDDGPF